MPESSRKGVLILECVDKSDPGSEGRFLSHMFDIMEVDSQYLEIRTKEQFLSMVQSSPFDVVHVTTHGHVAGAKERFVGFWTPSGTVRSDDFQKGSLKDKILVSTACKSGAKSFVATVVGKLGAAHYIAPRGSPRFRNSIFFCHWFYHKIFIIKVPIKKAVDKYKSGYKNPHDFDLFSKN